MKALSEAARGPEGSQPPAKAVGLEWTLAVTIVLTALALAQAGITALQQGILLTSWKWQLVVGAGVLGLALEITALVLSRRSGQAHFWETLARRESPIAIPRPAALLLFAGLAAVFPALTLGPAGRFLDSLPMRLLPFWLLSLAGAGLLIAGRAVQSQGLALAASTLVYAGIHQAATFLPEISTYPLAMGWSETSRYYYASLFLGEKIYGMPAVPSVLHPSRYLLQALPFLLPNSPLWLHRLWQVALWVGLTLASGLLLANRLGLRSRLRTWLVGLWAFLFLFQGPVLFHLLIAVIIVLAGFRSRRFWWSMAAVLLASLWAGLSRVNWLPVPGLLAAVMYFLEVPVGSPKNRRLFSPQALRYLTPPFLWVLAGSLAGLASQLAYIRLSGNQAEQFGSSFQSQLLWYRLFPSQTYPLGVLLALILASAPVLWLIGAQLKDHWRALHPIRLLALSTIGFVLFTTGLVVSAKIGGGSNLHNMDSYLITSALIAAYVYSGSIVTGTNLQAATRDPPRAVTALLILVPLAFSLARGGPLLGRDHDRAWQAIDELRTHIAEAQARGGEIVFISQRHLLTFGQVEGVSLVPEYEKVFLMEMAMSGNQPYLDTLKHDLAGHRFGLIVSHPLRIQYQGREHVFGEENDAWVANVSTPILCYYEPVVTLDGVPIQLLVARQGPVDCG